MKDYVGCSLQVRGAEKYILQNGKGDGMHFIYVRNGLGLEAWISLDRAGDISRLNYKGDNMGYFAPCGYVAPTYYDDKGAGFLKSFTAGFFTTCGLSAVGSPCVDDGEELPLHGTISNTPAEHLSTDENEKELIIKIRVVDARLFGRKLVLDRVYTFSYTDNTFTVEDTVTNMADAESPYMILYHCNMGYPLLDENSIVVVPNNGVVGRDDNAQNYVETALELEKPQTAYVERCYYYDVCEKDGLARVGIYNEELSKGLVMSYGKENLPCFTEWKQMGKTDYVLGLEPGNCTPDGRDVLREKGTLKFLKPDENCTTMLKFSFVNSKDKFESEF